MAKFFEGGKIPPMSKEDFDRFRARVTTPEPVDLDDAYQLIQEAVDSLEAIHPGQWQDLYHRVSMPGHWRSEADMVGAALALMVTMDKFERERMIGRHEPRHSSIEDALRFERETWRR